LLRSQKQQRFRRGDAVKKTNRDMPPRITDKKIQQRCRKKNTIPDTASSFLRPSWSDSIPTGNENRIPASGKTADTSPITTSFAPIACEKRGSTEFFERRC
jgi:hypothetical protein